MNMAEYYKLKKENSGLSEGEFQVKLWNIQQKEIRDNIQKQEDDRLEKKAISRIEQEIDKNLGSVIEKALFGGKSKMNISINI